MSRDGDSADLKGKLRDLGSYLIALGTDAPLDDDPKASLLLNSGTRQRSSTAIDDLPQLRIIAFDEYLQRRHRIKFFDSGYFGEPGWDILLDLFIARADGRQISVTSACIAADVPPTTALRWVSILEEEGLVGRKSDAFDKRRTWLFITDEGFRRMIRCLRERANPRRRSGRWSERTEG